MANVKRAADLTAQLLRLGYDVICPHTMTHGFEKSYPDIPDEVYLRNGLEQLKHCRAMILTENWETSTGTLAEIRDAKKLHIGVYTTIEELTEKEPIT